MKTDVRRAVALRVATELVRADKTTFWLSERSGIALPALQKKLAMRRDFTIADLADIANALDISVAQLAPQPTSGDR